MASWQELICPHVVFPPHPEELEGALVGALVGTLVGAPPAVPQIVSQGIPSLSPSSLESPHELR